jgi:hypothetical protein
MNVLNGPTWNGNPVGAKVIEFIDQPANCISIRNSEDGTLKTGIGKLIQIKTKMASEASWTRIFSLHLSTNPGSRNF